MFDFQLKVGGTLKHLVFWLLTAILGLFATSTIKANELKPLKITGGLEHPWGMVFLPDGDILVSERVGRLLRIDAENQTRQVVSGMPEIHQHGQGGLLGLALHPEFKENRWLYFAYVGKDIDGYSTHVARARYESGKLNDVQVIFEATPKLTSGLHFGGRLQFDSNGFLFVTLGDRGQRDLAQELENTAGGIVRLHDDGRIPDDNPFVNIKNANNALFTYGNRNVQGITLHPDNGELWTNEHGPQGGDEINVIRAGKNYGWPIITYGEEYGGGVIGQGLTKHDEMEQPLFYWTPSIAPSGMTFLQSRRYPPAWQGNLFVSSLKFRMLVRMTVDGEKIEEAERLLKNQIGRIRDVQEAPDGYLYLLTDSNNGALYRLEPLPIARSQP